MRKFALIYWGVPALAYPPFIPYLVRMAFAPVMFVLPAAVMVGLATFALFVGLAKRSSTRRALVVYRNVVWVVFASSFAVRGYCPEQPRLCVQLVGFLCVYGIILAEFINELMRLRTAQ